MKKTSDLDDIDFTIHFYIVLYAGIYISFDGGFVLM